MSHAILKGVSDEFNVPSKIKVYSAPKKYTEVQAEFRFRRPTRTELTQLSQSIQSAMKASDFDRVAETVREYLIGWQMNGADGQPVEFCDENVDIVLEQPDYLSALIGAFVSLLNPGRARAGN